MRRILLLTFIMLGLVAPVSLQGSAYAACNTGSTSKDQILTGVGTTGNDCQGTGVSNAVANVVSIFSYIIGVVSVIMIIYGGFLLITSAGDANKASSGRMTVLYAIVGLIIVVLAQFIVHFVLNKFG